MAGRHIAITFWVRRAIRPDIDGTIIGAINCFEDVTREHRMRDALARQQQTFDLAMIASKMGTWRYTVADNICLYDENAQKLYGLTDGRFLHDKAGVKDKLHPDDMDHMWARVAAAIDPVTGGRYEVEYRVKQLDGSWRWLSAWGIVKFDSEGPDRKPVARPTRRSFGSRLIESGFAGEDGGYARITYAPDGGRCEIGTSLAVDPNGLAGV